VTVTMTQDASTAISTVADRLAEFASTLPEVERREAKVLVEDLREAIVEDDVPPRKIRKWLERVGTLAATGSATAASTELVDLARTAIEQLAS
jgi:hypothetical protein